MTVCTAVFRTAQLLKFIHVVYSYSIFLVQYYVKYLRLNAIVRYYYCKCLRTTNRWQHLFLGTICYRIVLHIGANMSVFRAYQIELNRYGQNILWGIFSEIYFFIKH